jgi:hypothetical protein
MGKIPAKHSPFRGAVAAHSVTFTVGTETTNTINLAMQLKDANGASIGEKCAVDFYLSDSSVGVGVTATAPTGNFAIGTNGTQLTIITGKYAKLVSTAAGLVDVTLTETGTPTFYPVVIFPDGTIQVGSAITFA